MDYEVQRCTRQCAQTGRPLEPDETIYSVLKVEKAEVVRYDYSAQAWQGPPEGVLGWWKSRLPPRDGRRAQWAPNEVLLHLLEQLETDPRQADFRYVLALLLVRRRLLRLEEPAHDPWGHELLVVSSPHAETTYQIPVAYPTAERTQEIQDELARLLVSGGGADGPSAEKDRQEHS